MSSESRRTHRRMIEPALSPTQSVAPPIPRRGMTRRAFCAGAAFLAAAGALPLAGCSGLPFTGAAPVRLVVKVPRTGHDVVFDDSISQVEMVIQGMADEFQRTYARPVDVEVIVFEQNQYDEAVEGSFDTDKSPDVLYGDYFNISTYIRTGRVVPLDDVATPAIRDDLFDDLWNMGVVEGRAYMMPYLARQNVLAYNKEMFRNAGLGEFIAEGEITAWSLSEWTRILDALSASLPEGSFPMMMYAGSSQGDTHIVTLLRSAGSNIYDEAGHFNLSAPEGVSAFRWIQDGVGRGWFPPHAENLEIEDCSSLFRQGQLAIYMVNNASITRYGDAVGLVNFPGPDADGSATAFASGFQIFDNGDAEKLQVAGISSPLCTAMGAGSTTRRARYRRASACPTATGPTFPSTICSAPMPATYGISRATTPTPKQCAKSSIRASTICSWARRLPRSAPPFWTSAATPPSTKAGPKASCMSREKYSKVSLKY